MLTENDQKEILKMIKLFWLSIAGILVVSIGLNVFYITKYNKLKTQTSTQSPTIQNVEIPTDTTEGTWEYLGANKYIINKIEYTLFVYKFTDKYGKEYTIFSEEYWDQVHDGPEHDLQVIERGN